MSDIKIVSKTDQSLSDIFDVEPIGVMTRTDVVVEKVNVVSAEVKSPTEQNQDLNDDFAIARMTMHNILIRSQETLETAILIANGSEDPKSFDIVSNLIGKITDASSKLIILHSLKNNATPKSVSSEVAPVTTPGAVQVHGPVFVGSTSELALMITNSRKNTQ